MFFKKLKNRVPSAIQNLKLFSFYLSFVFYAYKQGVLFIFKQVSTPLKFSWAYCKQPFALFRQIKADKKRSLEIWYIRFSSSDWFIAKSILLVFSIYALILGLGFVYILADDYFTSGNPTFLTLHKTVNATSVAEYKYNIARYAENYFYYDMSLYESAPAFDLERAPKKLYDLSEWKDVNHSPLGNSAFGYLVQFTFLDVFLNPYYKGDDLTKFLITLFWPVYAFKHFIVNFSPSGIFSRVENTFMYSSDLWAVSSNYMGPILHSYFPVRYTPYCSLDEILVRIRVCLRLVLIELPPLTLKKAALARIDDRIFEVIDWLELREYKLPLKLDFEMWFYAPLKDTVVFCVYEFLSWLEGTQKWYLSVIVYGVQHYTLWYLNVTAIVSVLVSFFDGPCTRLFLGDFLYEAIYFIYAPILLAINYAALFASLSMMGGAMVVWHWFLILFHKALRGAQWILYISHLLFYRHEFYEALYYIEIANWWCIGWMLLPVQLLGWFFGLISIPILVINSMLSAVARPVLKVYYSIFYNPFTKSWYDSPIDQLVFNIRAGVNHIRGTYVIFKSRALNLRYAILSPLYYHWSQRSIYYLRTIAFIQLFPSQLPVYFRIFLISSKLYIREDLIPKVKAYLEYKKVELTFRFFRKIEAKKVSMHTNFYYEYKELYEALFGTAPPVFLKPRPMQLYELEFFAVRENLDLIENKVSSPTESQKEMADTAKNGVLLLWPYLFLWAPKKKVEREKYVNPFYRKSKVNQDTELEEVLSDDFFELHYGPDPLDLEFPYDEHIYAIEDSQNEEEDDNHMDLLIWFALLPGRLRFVYAVPFAFMVYDNTLSLRLLTEGLGIHAFTTYRYGPLDYKSSQMWSEMHDWCRDGLYYPKAWVAPYYAGFQGDIYDSYAEVLFDYIPSFSMPTAVMAMSFFLLIRLSPGIKWLIMTEGPQFFTHVICIYLVMHNEVLGGFGADFLQPFWGVTSRFGHWVENWGDDCIKYEDAMRDFEEKEHIARIDNGHPERPFWSYEGPYWDQILGQYKRLRVCRPRAYRSSYITNLHIMYWFPDEMTEMVGKYRDWILKSTVRHENWMVFEEYVIAYTNFGIDIFFEYLLRSMMDVDQLEAKLDHIENQIKGHNQTALMLEQRFFHNVRRAANVCKRIGYCYDHYILDEMYVTRHKIQYQTFVKHGRGNCEPARFVKFMAGRLQGHRNWALELIYFNLDRNLPMFLLRMDEIAEQGYYEEFLYDWRTAQRDFYADKLDALCGLECIGPDEDGLYVYQRRDVLPPPNIWD